MDDKHKIPVGENQAYPVSHVLKVVNKVLFTVDKSFIVSLFIHTKCSCGH